MRMPTAESARLMSGMPRRSMPAMKPAAKFDPGGMGAPARRTPHPAPWTIWIFSSRVISAITRSARLSGERDLFIHGIFAVSGLVFAEAAATPIEAAVKTAKIEAATERTSLRDDIQTPSNQQPMTCTSRPSKVNLQVDESLKQLKRYSKAFKLGDFEVLSRLKIRTISR